MKLGDFIVPDAIVVPLQNTERDSVIKELISALVTADAISSALHDELVREIITREKHGSTGFGKGVAVPHAKHDKLKQMVAAIGVCQNGVDFNALDKEPVYSVILLLSPKDQPDEHLHAMENIFSNLQNTTFRKFLRQATTVQAVQELILEADTQQL